MSEQILSRLRCTICLETYQPPIRMLPCGHNFCESCLVALQTTSLQQLRCPKCRKTVLILRNDFSSLPRCHDLENVIEDLMKLDLSNKQSQKFDAIPVLSGDAITQLSERAAWLMNNKNYQKALELLQIVTKNKQTSDKIFYMINKATCQIEIGLKEDAVVTATKIISLAATLATPSTNYSTKIHIFEQLIVMCEKFFKFDIIDIVFPLVNCLFSLTKTFYNDQNQLNMFVKISALLEDLVIKMLKNNEQNQINKTYCLFDEIIDNMQMKSDVDLKFKCKRIVSVLKYYGFCCIKRKDYSKSEIIYHNAISMMELEFGSAANQCIVLGFFCNDLGRCNMKLNRFEEAKLFFLKALNVIKEATDLIDENRRPEMILNVSKNLQFVETQLKTKQIEIRN